MITKKKLKDELKAMTASSMLVYRVLTFMPFILIFIILMLNKDYFNPLFNNILGIFAIILALILYTIYILVIRKILKVEVWKV